MKKVKIFLAFGLCLALLLGVSGLSVYADDFVPSAQVHTVTFQFNGGIKDGKTSETVQTGTLSDGKGKLSSIPSSPVGASWGGDSDVYVFAGWYINKEGALRDSNKIDTEYIFTGPMTVYARWYVGLEIGTGEPLEKTQGVPFYLPGRSSIFLPTLAGKACVGWVKRSDTLFETTETTVPAWKPGDRYTLEGGGELLPIWRDAWTVSLELDGGALAGTDQVSRIQVEKGKSIGELPVPIMNDFIFSGWYNKPINQAGSALMNGTETIGEHRTYYAKWLAAIRITFYENAGDQSTTIIENIKSGELIGTGDRGFARSGYVLKGWNTEPDALGVELKNTDKATEPQEYYAVWQDCVTITFLWNDGTSNARSVTIERDGRIRSDALPVPTRKGYAFAGWYDAATGGEKLASDKTHSEGSSYYAHWDANSDKNIVLYGNIEIKLKNIWYNWLIVVLLFGWIWGPIFIRV